MQILWRGWAAAALILALWSGAGQAQTWPVEKIVFAGPAVNQGELLQFTGLKPGQLTREVIEAAADRLSGTGLFSNVRFGIDGTTLTFELEASATAVPVVYDNFPWWDDKALNAAVAARVPLFHGALDPAGSMREQVTAVLVSLLAAKDVRGATISTAPVTDADGNQTAIRYHIDTPPMLVGVFHVYGFSGVWTQPVEAVEKTAFRQKIEAATRAALADQVRSAYGKLGFIDVQMSEPAWGQPLVTNGEVIVPLTATVTSEGGQYHVAAIELHGDLFLAQEQFAQSAKLHAGDVADEELWKETQTEVQAPYRTHGYLKAKILATAQPDREHHTVRYTIAVDPGAEYRMGQVKFENLNAQQQAELMPYWQLHPGDVFNPDLIAQSIGAYHSKQPQAQQLVRAGYRAHWSADTVNHTVDVVLTFNPQQN
jgi:outer membrane protein assembly factor BamA